MTQKNILVVGGCGYIGTHMVRALLEAGYHAVVLDNLSTGHLELLPGGEFIHGDIGDDRVLDHLFTKYDIDAVMHFAAFIEVGESVKNPLKYYNNNVSATINLLEAMHRHGVEKFIFSSSAAVYGAPEYTPINECHPCKPSSPYGQTKLMVETILRECSQAFGICSVALRYFNAAGADPNGGIGEVHNPETHLIPLAINAALQKGPPLCLFGDDYDTHDGTALRDYVHVCDLTDAHIKALCALENGQKSLALNLGCSVGYSVQEVISAVGRVTGKTVPCTVAQRRPGDPAVLVADASLAKEVLDWEPQYSDLDTIIETAYNFTLRSGLCN